jgi:hypothetical protein
VEISWLRPDVRCAVRGRKTDEVTELDIYELLCAVVASGHNVY